MRDGFAYAASRAGKEPPEIVVSVLLIPEWDAGNTYSTRRYTKAQEDFLAEMRAALDAGGLTGVRLENFYDKASEDERAYLEHLQARGSCADMVKTHAIISPENADRRHLQIDSNTQLHDFEGFYNDTFNAEEPSDHLVRLNASYYDEDYKDYVSVHNKVVFTFPHSPFADALREEHLRYCREHKDDHLSTVPRRMEEKKTKNSIYAKDFVVASSTLGLARRADLTGPDRTIFPAAMERPEYAITHYVVTAVNRSWGPGVEEPREIVALKNMPPFSVGDTSCDYASFCNAVKKHTGYLSAHKYGAHPERWTTDTAASRLDDTEARATLLSISDTVVDKVVIARFYNHAIRTIASSDLSPEDQLRHMEVLASYFPDSRRGNELTQELFGCSVEELKANPRRYSSEYGVAELADYRRLEIQRLGERIDLLEKRMPSSGAARYHVREAIAMLSERRTALIEASRLHRFDSWTDDKVREAYERDSRRAMGVESAGAGGRLTAKVEEAVLRRELAARATHAAGEEKASTNPYSSMSHVERERIKRIMEERSDGVGHTREAIRKAKQALAQIRAAEGGKDEGDRESPLSAK
jgi:hemerythrin-like domain-containing protein